MTQTLPNRTTIISALGALALFLPPAADAQEAGFPFIGAVTEESWVFETSHLSPRGDLQEAIRSLEAVSITAMRSWRFGSGVETQLGGGLFHAGGTTRDLFTPEPPRPSDADGLRAGGRIRYNLVRIGDVEPFIDAYAGVLWTPGQPFPVGGTGVNGMFEWGGGFEAAASDKWSIAAGWRNNHISNGGGMVKHNPAWDSNGAFLSVRRTIGRS